jgi:His-Xaa-Ser repeat protein HxsA
MLKKIFAIPTLLAAGVFAYASSDKAATSEEASFTDNISDIISSIENSHEYTLAGHRSHGSHGSHGSHQSHRSGRVDVPPSEGLNDSTGISSNLMGTRNIRSTPPRSFLPSSFGVTKKIKALPGNSLKFKNILLRVQLSLNSSGYSISAIGSGMNAQTVAAIYRFQKDRGMIPSGKLTNNVLSALGISAV